MQPKNDQLPLPDEQPLTPVAPTPMDVFKKPLSPQEMEAGIELHGCFGMISLGGYLEPVSSLKPQAAA